MLTLIDALCGVDIICAAVALNGALEAGASRGIVRAVGLHDVVLDQWASGPAVD